MKLGASNRASPYDYVMTVPGWVDPVAKASEIVGATVGVLAYIHDKRDKRRKPEPATSQATRVWLWIALVMCAIALAASVLQLADIVRNNARIVIEIVAIVAASAALASLAVYTVLRRRQPLPLPETLRDLIDAQWEEARRHTYQYTVGAGVPLLPDIYVEQHAEWVLATGERTRAQRLTLAQMLGENHNAVVLAEPGVGKSTAAAKVMWEQCDWLRSARRKAKLKNAPYGPVIPIALPPSLHGCGNVSAALAKECERLTGTNLGAQMFSEPPPFGKSWLIVVDGIDQVLDIPARDKLLQLLGNWLGYHYRLLITTRPLLGWEFSYLKAESFGFFRLKKFNASALREFAERWAAIRSANPIPGGTPLTVERFLASVRVGTLASLVKVPLIATITALLLETQQDRQALPTSRDALYEKFVRHLLASRPWQDYLGQPPPPAFAVYGEAGRRAWTWIGENVRPLLEGVADLSLTIGAPTVHDCAVTWIRSNSQAGIFDEVSAWEDALDALLTATSLIVPERGTLRFVHPSLAEHLAAEPRAAGFDPETWLADAQSPDSRSLALFVLARRSRQWGAAVADSVVELLLDRGGTDACIAGEVIADGISVSEQLRERVISTLMGRLTTDAPDTGAALHVLADLMSDPAVLDRLVRFAQDPDQPGWVRADVADLLGETQLFREIHNSTSDTWLRQRILLKLRALGVATEQEIAQADYQFTVAQSGPASPGARAGEWYRRMAESGGHTPAQRIRAALALAERRDDGWQPLVERLLIDEALSADNRFQAARQLSADPEGTRLLHRLADQESLEVRVPVLAALASVKYEPARQLLNEIQRREGPSMLDRFPQLDSWREEVGARSYEQQKASLSWEPPPQDPYFTGRMELMEAIRTSLARGWVCLTGPAGVGKTQITLAYAELHRTDYDSVRFISSEGRRHPLVRSVLGNSRRRRRCLVIVDNLHPREDLAVLRQNDRVDVLITSRNRPAWRSELRTDIVVPTLTREESVTLLRARLRRGIAARDADDLAGLLADHPRALSQAAATIAQSGMSVHEYLEQLKGRKGARLERSLEVTVDTLRAELPEAETLLSCCAVFGEAPIPLDIFKPGVLDAGTQLADLLNDAIALNRILRELGRLSLVSVGNRMITVPKKIRTLFRDSLTSEQQEALRKQVHLLLAAATPITPENISTWPRYQELFPHLRDLGIAESSVVVVRDLALVTAQYLRASGNPKRALEFTERLVDTRGEPTTGPFMRRARAEHVTVLSALGMFGEAESVMGALAPAEPMTDADVALAAVHGSYLRAAGRFSEALDHDRSVERKVPESLRYLANINVALDQVLIGEFTAAWRTLQEQGAKGNVLAGIRLQIDLSRVARLCGFDTDALSRSTDVINQCRELLGPRHPLTLQAIRERGLAGPSLELLDDVQSVLFAFTDILGENHLETLATMIAIANMTRVLGKPERSRVTTKEAMQGYSDVFGEHHPFTLACSGNLAILLRRRGDLEAARELNERCLEGLQNVTSLYALAIATNLASDLAALGERDTAVEFGQSTLAECTEKLGVEHPFTRACAANLELDRLGAMGQWQRQNLQFDPPRI